MEIVTSVSSRSATIWAHVIEFIGKPDSRSFDIVASQFVPAMMPKERDVSASALQDRGELFRLVTGHDCVSAADRKEY